MSSDALVDEINRNVAKYYPILDTNINVGQLQSFGGIDRFHDINLLQMRPKEFTGLEKRRSFRVEEESLYLVANWFTKNTKPQNHKKIIFHK